MRKMLTMVVLAYLPVAAGCTSSNSVFEGDGRDGVGSDGATGEAGDGGTVADDVGGTADDGWGSLPDGGCMQVTCQEHLYACGNCLDDDDDVRTDWADPDCLGPCDNNESGFFLEIPGGDARPCALDCYFDQDEGPGNDQCLWDHRCDPLEPDHNPLCRYRSPPPPDANCPATQRAACLDFCLRLTPNGCDCFGCCELPGGSGNWVFIGSVGAGGGGTCTLANRDDPDLCHPCTPVESCLNGCGPCELCLGRTDLPPACFGGGEDGGTPGERCPEGVRPCGLEGDLPCPEGYYCITGCCQITIF